MSCLAERLSHWLAPRRPAQGQADKALFAANAAGRNRASDDV